MTYNRRPRGKTNAPLLGRSTAPLTAEQKADKKRAELAAKRETFIAAAAQTAEQTAAQAATANAAMYEQLAASRAKQIAYKESVKKARAAKRQFITAYNDMLTNAVHIYKSLGPGRASVDKTAVVDGLSGMVGEWLTLNSPLLGKALVAELRPALAAVHDTKESFRVIAPVGKLAVASLARAHLSRLLDDPSLATRFDLRQEKRWLSLRTYAEGRRDADGTPVADDMQSDPMYVKTFIELNTYLPKVYGIQLSSTAGAFVETDYTKTGHKFARWLRAQELLALLSPLTAASVQYERESHTPAAKHVLVPLMPTMTQIIEVLDLVGVRRITRDMVLSDRQNAVRLAYNVAALAHNREVTAAHEQFEADAKRHANTLLSDAVSAFVSSGNAKAVMEIIQSFQAMPNPTLRKTPLGGLSFSRAFGKFSQDAAYCMPWLNNIPTIGECMSVCEIVNNALVLKAVTENDLAMHVNPTHGDGGYPFLLRWYDTVTINGNVFMAWRVWSYLMYGNPLCYPNYKPTSNIGIQTRAVNSLFVDDSWILEHRTIVNPPDDFDFIAARSYMPDETELPNDGDQTQANPTDQMENDE